MTTASSAITTLSAGANRTSHRSRAAGEAPRLVSQHASAEATQRPRSSGRVTI